MNTDGNTDAINRHIDELEEYDEQQELRDELQDLRDEVDTLAAKLDQCEAERAIGITEGDVVAHMNVALLHGQLLETKAKLAEVTAERDNWMEAARMHHNAEAAFLKWLREAGEHMRAEGVTVCDDGIDSGEILAAKVPACAALLQVRAEADEAMLPRAYRAGVEAVAATMEKYQSERCSRCGQPRNDHHYRHPFVGVSVPLSPFEVRALPTPTIEQLKEMLKETKL